jgi:hypothetical protein
VGVARYRKIDVRVWIDERFRELSRAKPNSQTLWLYLLTNPDTVNVPGLYRAGEAAMAEALGWDLKGFRKAFAEISARGMAFADWEARVVWIPKAIMHNPPENPNVVKSWAATWDEIPECGLKAKAWSEMKAFLEGKPFGEGFGKAFLEACPEPFPQPLPKGFGESGAGAGTGGERAGAGSLSPNRSAKTDPSLPPRTSAAAEERERSAQSASAGTGNGSEAELEPDDPTRATVGRVLERWAQRFPDLPIENANDRGELMHDLEARIREWPDLGEWEHAFDQLERQPFLRRGLNRQRGPATLARKSATRSCQDARERDSASG